MLSNIENLLFVVLLIRVVWGLKEDRRRKYEETPLLLRKVFIHNPVAYQKERD